MARALRKRVEPLRANTLVVDFTPLKRDVIRVDFTPVELSVAADSGPIDPNLSAAAQQIREWRNDPVKFVWDNFHVVPDAWQKKVLKLFPLRDPDKLRISMQACAGPGKSALMAWCGWFFLSCYGDEQEHPKGAVVSITWDNLRDNLWSEFSKWQQQSEFLKSAFTWTKERIFAKDHPETWFLSARSWSKTANPDEQGRTLSGLHSRYVLALIDESGEIPTSVLKAAEQALSNCWFGKIIQAGNPSSLDGMLYAAASTLRHQWTVVRITGDPDDPDRSPRIDLEWAKEQIKIYGRDNPWVMAYILGQFPPASLNALLGVEEVEAAMKKHFTEDEFIHMARVLGVDVAREGDDRTVIFPRQGRAAFMPVIMRTQKGHEVAARVAQGWHRWDADACMFDDTGGWAGAAIESLQDAGYSPIPVNFSGKAFDPRYLNKRAEMWFEMADWVKKGGALPNIPELVAELTTPTYTFVNGKFKLEEKDQIKKRLGRSPDIADALALTFAVPVAPPIRDPLSHQKFPQHHQVVSEYDPFSDERLGNGPVITDYDPFSHDRI